jgi:hypothetical protein
VVICAGEANTGEDLLGSARVQSTLVQRVLPFHAVASNAHRFNVATFNKGVNLVSPG